jgi:uncharacterized protein DUF3558
MLIRRSLLLASLFGLAIASACTTTSKGDPLPANSTGVATSKSTPRTSGGGEEELPFAGAPKVTNPLNTSRYEQDPCLSLSSEQARELNLPAVGKATENEVLGVGCEWYNEETRGNVTIVFIVDDPRGLSPEYDTNNRKEWAYFEVLPAIEGYPAVTRSLVDDRDIGHCTVVVGAADDMAFETILQLSQANVGQKDPCATAAEVAGLAVKTMKQGA